MGSEKENISGKMEAKIKFSIYTPRTDLLINRIIKVLCKRLNK